MLITGKNKEQKEQKMWHKITFFLLTWFKKKVLFLIT